MRMVVGLGEACGTTVKVITLLLGDLGQNNFNILEPEFPHLQKWTNDWLSSSAYSVIHSLSECQVSRMPGTLLDSRVEQ